MKNSVKLLSVLFLSVFLLGLVSSANTLVFNLPNATVQQNMSGATWKLNASFDTNDESLGNITYWYRLAVGTGAWTLINNVTQIGNATDNYNVTWTISGLGVDRQNIEINATARNTTETSVVSLISKNVTVHLDNGDPTATISSNSFVDNTNVIRNTSFTFGVADATIGISSCLLSFTNQANNTIITQSVSAVSNNCSYLTDASSMSLAIDEKYNVRMEATDGNGDKANSSARAIKVTVASGGGGGGSAVKQTILGDESGTGTGVSGGIGQAISNFVNGIINFFKGLFN